MLFLFLRKLTLQSIYCSFVSLLGGFDRSILDGGDFILDHWSHWVWVVWFSSVLLFYLTIIEISNLVVDNWLLWLWIFGSISNDWWISLDCGGIHWDFIVCLFSLLWFLSGNLWFGGGLSVLLLTILSSGFLLLFLCWGSFLCWCGWSSCSSIWGWISAFDIFLHIFGKWFY